MGRGVVVGVDGSEHAARALSFAVGEVRRRDVPLEAVMAVDYYPGAEFGAIPTSAPTTDDLKEQARRALEAILEDLPDDIEVNAVVSQGPPARALLARTQGADLLVVGSRGRGGFQGLLLGSTSHRVISHASCPVVVVPRALEDAKL